MSQWPLLVPVAVLALPALPELVGGGAAVETGTAITVAVSRALYGLAA
ncbi:hypothetical protein ACIRPX_28800 [Streptomyces sp. NPDC101225]